MEGTYWNHNGKHQELSEKLQKLIPFMGEVSHGRGKNKHLERLRKATNCYYDLYNNGLCNKARQFSSLFKVSVGGFKDYDGYYNSQALGKIIEPLMDDMILAAAKEQKIV